MTSPSRFEGLGADYATSASHARGRTLSAVLEKAAPGPSDRALDVGTGAGHMALALAPKVKSVIGADPTADMLAAAVGLGRERGLTNARWVLATAERLPFPSGVFDLVVSRTAAHHFEDLPAACREWARVLKPGGRCVVTDLAGYEDAALHAFVHGLEVLHDPGHGRAHTPVEWRVLLGGAGLEVLGVEEGLVETPEGMSLKDWCGRARTPPETVAEIARRLKTAPEAWRRFLDVREEGSDLRFRIYKLVVSAVRG